MTVSADDYTPGLSAGRTGSFGGGVSTFFGGGTSSSEPPVFWGSTPGRSEGRVVTTLPSGQEVRGSNQPVLTTLPSGQQVMGSQRSVMQDDLRSKSRALLEFYSWTPAERAKWGRHLLSLGLVDEDEAEDYYTLEEWWKQVIDDTANLTMAGKRLTPFQVARLIAGGEEGAARRRARAAEGEEAPFSGTKTQTSTSIDITDPKTAKALVNSVLAEALGRAANPEELAAFTATLNSAERANPLRTTSTGTYQDGELVSRSDTTTGGLTGQARSQILMDEAMAKPEYGAYQSATYYLNALTQAIQSPV